MLNKEKIINNFKLPIYYNKYKKKLSDTLKEDLELINGKDGKKSVYEELLQTSNEFDKSLLYNWSEFYTTDKHFLKDNQTFFKKTNDLKNDPTQIEKVQKVWNNIKNETNFLEKFQYLEWDRLTFLNQSKFFLSILSFYNISSPVIQLLSPIFFFITPFFVMRGMGINITTEMYYDVLKQNITQQPFVKLFISFNTMSLGQQIYGLLMLGLYIYNFYSNIVSCYKFYIQMKFLTQEFDTINNYLDYTLTNMNLIRERSKNLDSFALFKNDMERNIQKISKFKNDIKSVPKNIFKGFNITHIGNIMKYYYLLWDNLDIEEMFFYTFGFNCYYNNIIGLHRNITNKKINKCTFNKKSVKLTQFYHPNIIGKPIKNNIKMTNNKIITGPNAAGKTTLLKSITVNIILSQQIGFGYYKKARINPYHHIHCYINIPDTNNRDSLFQSEARRCKNILDIIDNNIHERHFCIFDELYSGTNPYEAVAAAYSYLKYISERKKVSFILTTHYINLCKKLNNVENIENINMKSTILNNKPKYFYKIQKGISKIKGGVHVLKQLDYPDIIIENARSTLSKL
jgi:hypothetical protein